MLIKIQLIGLMHQLHARMRGLCAVRKPAHSSVSMVARIGSLATTNRKPRQARKGAAVAVTSGAGV